MFAAVGMGRFAFGVAAEGGVRLRVGILSTKA